MCGIIGYTDPLEARDVLLEGLTGLKYRGYDNAGIAHFNQDSLVRAIRKMGKVTTLRECIRSADEISHYGIGHTRWATHGGVTDVNAYPHSFRQVTLIHNRIIENYHQPTQEYELEGYLVFQTDNEVAAAIPDSAYRECGQDSLKAVAAFIDMLGGSYGFYILFADRPGEIYAVRRVNPPVTSHTHSGALVAPDLTTLISYTREHFVVPGGCIVRLTPYKVCTCDMDFNHVKSGMLEVSQNMDAAMKNGYLHFMPKEIHEQPDILKSTISSRMVDHLLDFRDDSVPDSMLVECTQVRIIVCGTAMHVGMVAKALMEPMFRISVTVSIASKSQYEDPLIDPKILVVVISQSGETIDTLIAMNLAKSLDPPMPSITNVKGSTIARKNNYVFHTHMSPEIVVAGIKAYSVQLAAPYMIGCRMALVRGAFSHNAAREFMKDLIDVISTMEIMTGQSEFIRSSVHHLVRERDTFFTGKGLDYALFLEGTLKLRKTSHIHAEAYAAGELKHGTIALTHGNVPIITIATQGYALAKTISNIREVEARGTYVILLAKKQPMAEGGVVDMELRIPDPEDRFTVFPIAVVPQLIAYYAPIGRHPSVDQPRSLAKFVTVE